MYKPTPAIKFMSQFASILVKKIDLAIGCKPRFQLRGYIDPFAGQTDTFDAVYASLRPIFRQAAWREHA